MTNRATREQLVPAFNGEQLIDPEHLAGYALAAQLASGRRVLDAGCGAGWGTCLLLAARASSATGLDRDSDAVATARARIPGAHFVQGELTQLPWDPGVYDLVVCVDALEHAADLEKALDELVRVLAPQGLLLVSSPYPRADQATDPLDRHEFSPEKLREAVGRRLPNVVLWSRQLQIASILMQEGTPPAPTTRQVLTWTLAPLTSGSDPFSIVIAGREPSPSLPPLLFCAPSDEPLGLKAAGAQLSRREGMFIDETQGAREREQVVANPSKALLDIAAQKKAVNAATKLITSLQRQNEALRRERDQAAALLLDSEQEMSKMLSTVEAKLREQEQVAASLALQVAAFRTSKSWRLTEPLRVLARRRLAKR